MGAGVDMDTAQILLYIAVIALDGLAISAIGWFVDRRWAAFRDASDGILRATIAASVFATGLWFLGLFVFGGGFNLYGTALMGGSGGAIAMLVATIIYRRRRSRLADPRAEALRDTFS